MLRNTKHGCVIFSYLWVSKAAVFSSIIQPHANRSSSLPMRTNGTYYERDDMEVCISTCLLDTTPTQQILFLWRWCMSISSYIRIYYIDWICQIVITLLLGYLYMITYWPISIKKHQFNFLIFISVSNVHCLPRNTHLKTYNLHNKISVIGLWGTDYA